MKTIEELSEILKNSVSSLSIPDNPCGLYEPIRYIMEDGGKRLRPLLMLLAVESFKMDATKFLNQALAIEIFHNFTLLHDDIMDRALIRRNRQTVHLKWNDNTAILSGDAMAILSYKFLLKDLPSQHTKDVIEIFNKAALEVCEGQQMDMDFESMEKVSIDEYVEMIRLKTAVLLAASLEIGATLASADYSSRKALYEFGEYLGLAFQIQDDILDTYGNSSVFGKQIGGDIREGKKTFLRIVAFLKADDNDRKLLMQSRDYDIVRNLYDKLDVRQEAESEIEKYFTLAISSLNRCNTLDKVILSDFAKRLLKRNK